MPNHFHLVVEPTVDGQLSVFMQLLLGTHALRWNVFRKRSGQGAVYQGRFKAFPVQDDRHFLTVCRYVERNPVRAGLVSRPESWAWSSFSRNCVTDNAGARLMACGQTCRVGVDSGW